MSRHSRRRRKTGASPVFSGTETGDAEIDLDEFLAWAADPGSASDGPGSGAATETHDPDLEEKEYGRSLMSFADRAKLGQRSPVQVYENRDGAELIRHNTVKTFEGFTLDPDLMLQIDIQSITRFVTADGVYLREELAARHPLTGSAPAPRRSSRGKKSGLRDVDRDRVYLSGHGRKVRVYRGRSRLGLADPGLAGPRSRGQDENLSREKPVE